MKSSIATVCISGSLREKLTAISRAGFDGYELFENDFVTSSLSAEDVRERSADLGLTLDLYQPFRDVEGTTPERFAASLERARHKFQLMHRLGVDTMLVCSNVGTATIDDDALAAEQLNALADVAADHGVRIAYEALAWGRYVSTYDHSWRLVEAADHPALGICLDSFHILSRGSDLTTIAEIPAEKLFFVQLADAPAMNLDVLSWSRHHRLFPGEGDWDLAAFVKRVLEAGYRGPLSLEVFNDVFRQGEPSVTARDARRSLLVLENEVRRLAVTADVDLLDVPAAEPPHGFGFVELQPGEGDAVPEMLALLGFRGRGHHRRKNVELWEQGTARVIVNNELEGREARLAAVGVEVADVAKASARAQALKTRRVARDQQPDEETLGAIEAPDGTEFYFTPLAGDATWHDEFESPATGAADAGVVGIDHLALVQPWQRMDEAALFYRSILGLEIDDGQDLLSESGLIRSRALVSKDRGIRLAVNVVPVHAPAGSSFPNHIALSTDDILATTGTLLERGLELLRMPDNYYDDLAARFGLEPARVDELRAHRVLYDRDADGGFLHAYTPPIGQVYFELVERQPGYDGYGAPNASVRLAAMRVDPIVRRVP
ncbi:MAG: bifunctional sugar phosphate isomerase/epimerase/4-hydroxyphenylpyruvate dioxygenase family protein [Microbacteriaceae bacterium]